MEEQITFTAVLEKAAKLPIIHIDRTAFLTKNLSKICTPEQLQKAITDGTIRAGVPLSVLDSLANAVINAETLKVTAISTATGLPGGAAVLATIPADMAQFYGFVIRIAQELAYLYGWDEMFVDGADELDTETESLLVAFIGVMSGVKAANGVVSKLFGAAAMRAVEKKIATQALTKGWLYPVVKKIAALLGVRMVKTTFAGGIAKVVPVVGGVISGGLTLTTFKPMACRLKKHLSKLAHMTPEEYAAYEKTVVINEDAITIDETDSEEETETNYWVCTCGAKNKGKFCTECGSAKPAGIPTYRCDKCGWEPEDKTRPPKFCPECGDPFDEGDIVTE